jgi:hypothetical protein
MRLLPPALTTLLLAFTFTRLCLATPITAEGEKLIRVLDSMHVEEHWIAGAIVDWRTGDPTGKPITDNRKHTHCSQFATAVCEKLGVYLLRPPEFRGALLANAQYDWLADQGRAKGWAPVADGRTAQELANAGTLVVAVYKNPDPTKSGHTAIIRPSTKSIAEIRLEGPQVTQAGGTNRNSCSLKQGFGNHPNAFKDDEIRFFSHDVRITATALRGN